MKDKKHKKDSAAQTENDIEAAKLAEIMAENDKKFEELVAASLEENEETQIRILDEIYPPPLSPITPPPVSAPEGLEPEDLEEWLKMKIAQPEEPEQPQVKRKKEMTPEEAETKRIAWNLKSSIDAQQARRDYYKYVTHTKPNGEVVNPIEDYIAKTRFTMEK
jgi:hypothetical protein